MLIRSSYCDSYQVKIKKSFDVIALFGSFQLTFALRTIDDGNVPIIHDHLSRQYELSCLLTSFAALVTGAFEFYFHTIIPFP
jgi:hypothetical protein